MRVGFITCVGLGLSCMEEIYEVGGSLVFAGTLRDDQARGKAGRVYLDSFCAGRSIPLVKFRHINDAEAVAAVRSAQLDWLMIIGWSQIAGSEVLAASRLGALGMHPSLLPQGRGRAAVPSAILLGLQATGVTLFRLEAGVDTGPIAGQVRISLDERETATSLYARVNDAHRELIRNCWPGITSGALRFDPQDHSSATVWEARTPEQGRLDSTMSVAEADRLVRAVTRPYPGAFIDRRGRRLRVWKAEPLSSVAAVESGRATEVLEFGDGQLRVLEAEWEDTGTKPA